ncbi:MAG TPA: LCP family protein [Trebonia sp.]|jgi:LCP family protein required for cell wall assembly|nr:LCP family protein [Trebonia sp.]
MLTGRGGQVIAGKVGYAVACLVAAVVLVVSGYAYKVVGYASAPNDGVSTGDGPSTSAQAMNILVMGLESRTNFYGQALPPALITAMHTGPVGGQDPNTLILIHIFAGGQKAVGFSIPRDDLVSFPTPFNVDGINIPDGKIDNAYDWAYTESLAKTGSSDKNDYLLANQAGQGAEIKTVEALTGVHIDHFVETNLAGFYYLAQAFHGVEVCIKPEEPKITTANYTSSNLYDFNSGFNAVKYDHYNLRKGGPQYLHLSAPQALAFVRERDNLAEGDIDRTRRQQAVIDYVIWQLKHENAFADVGTINALLSAASQYLITDPSLNLLDFATDMQALSGQHLSFTTLPSVPGSSQLLPGYGSSPQSVNIISVPYIRRLVHAAFYPQPKPAKAKTAEKKARPAPPASSVTVDVYNGDLHAAGLAGNVSQALVSRGYKAGAVENASAQSQPVKPANQVFYGAGASANAAKIATDVGATARPLASLPAGHVEILIGSAVTATPAGLAAAVSSGASPSASSSSSAPAGSVDGGGTIKVGANAKFGIPCVY